MSEPVSVGDKQLCVLREVSLSFRTPDARIDVFAGLNLSVQAGERLAIVGRSGSGKSSLLFMIAGLLRPTSGSVEVCGVDLTGVSEAERAGVRKNAIGFVFQNFILVPTMSAVANAALPLRLRGVGRREAEQRAAELLEHVGLGRRLRSRPSQLSGGEQQRVAIVRAAISEPRLLLCDEPTGNLDTSSQAEVMTLIAASTPSMGATVLCTHDRELAAGFDRVIDLGETSQIASDRA